MSSGVRLDLHTEPIDDVLSLIEDCLGVALARDTAVFGNQGDTVGLATAADRWVRVQWRHPVKFDVDLWAGPESATVLEGVAMPETYRALRWQDNARGVVWRADEVELVTSPAVSASGSIADMPVLTEAWWAALRTSLSALAGYATHRVAMSQVHLAGRLSEVFGSSLTADADLTVPEWTTAHGDLHWGNLTAPEFYILDWASWGQAPRGYDAATLWGVSLGVPDIASRLEHEFAGDLTTRSGKLSQLMFCANVLRQFAKRGKTFPFTDGVRAATPRLLRELGLSDQ